MVVTLARHRNQWTPSGRGAATNPG
jgi:hypothetical protein